MGLPSPNEPKRPTEVDELGVRARCLLDSPWHLGDFGAIRLIFDRFYGMECSEGRRCYEKDKCTLQATPRTWLSEAKM